MARLYLLPCTFADAEWRAFYLLLCRLLTEWRTFTYCACIFYLLRACILSSALARVTTRSSSCFFLYMPDVDAISSSTNCRSVERQPLSSQ